LSNELKVRKPLFVHDRCAVIVSLQTSYLIESKDNDRSKS